MDLSHKAFAPNTYLKTWDGYQFVLEDIYSHDNIVESLSGGLRMLPELAFSAFDSKVQVKFSRTRRDWGDGDGSSFYALCFMYTSRVSSLMM